MFLSFCHALNALRLSWIAAALRYVVASFAPLSEGRYANPDAVGYDGWIDSPLGVLAFIRRDGSLQWRW